jgi:hypothetical protein
LWQLAFVTGPEFVDVAYPAAEILSRNGITKGMVENLEEKTTCSYAQLFFAAAKRTRNLPRASEHQKVRAC